MTLTFFCRLAADLSLFYAFANCALLFISPENGAAFWWPAASLLASGALSYGLKTKIGRVPAAAAPLIIPLAVPFLLPGWLPFFVTIPPFAYLAYLLYMDMEQLPYSDYHDRFFQGARLLFLLLLPLLFSFKPGMLQLFQTRILPFVFFYLLYSVLSLRLNRYQPETLQKKSTQLANCLLLALFTFACLSVVYSNIWALLGQMAATVYRFVLAPVILLVAVLIALPFFALGMLLKLLAGEPQTDENLLPAELGEFIDTGMEAYSSLGIPPFLRYAFICLVAIGVLYVVWRFFRRLAARGGRKATPDAIIDKRQKLETQSGRSIDWLPPSDPRRAIRYYYRRFLRLCRKYGLPPRPSQTSRDIGDGAAMLLTDVAEAGTALKEFRALYLPARYDDSGYAVFGKQDADKAKSDFHIISKALSTK